MAHGRAEGGLADCGFGTGVDEQRKILGVLHPARHETPAHQQGPAIGQVAAAFLPFALHDDQNGLGRRDIETGGKILKADQIEIIGNLLGRRLQHETSAHRLLLMPLVRTG